MARAIISHFDPIHIIGGGLAESKATREIARAAESYTGQYAPYLKTGAAKAKKRA